MNRWGGLLLLWGSVAGQAATLSIHLEDGRPTLAWSNQVGRAYRVESAFDAATGWPPRVTLTGDGPDLSWADETGATAQVYRVVEPADAAPFGGWQQTLEATRLNQGIVGAVAAAMLPGDELWIGSSGYSHDSVPVRPQTRFEIGSVTKTMVAAMTLRLVEEERLSLDDTISQWLPGLDHPHIAGAITLRQLLSHRSGVYNFGDDIPFRQALFSDWARHWQPQEVLDYVTAPYFQPGRGGTYSNTGYVLAGMIVQQMSTAGLAAELRRTVFDPAGMRASVMGGDETWAGELAHLHLDFNGDGIHEDLHGNPQTAILSSFWTSGAVVSTAADVARFGATLFDGTLLGPGSLSAMRTFQAIAVGPSTINYGLGLMRYTVDGLEYWAHSGGLFGHYAWFSYCPDIDVSVAVVYNFPQTVAAGPSFPLDLLRAIAASLPAAPAAARTEPIAPPAGSTIALPEHLLTPVHP